MGKGDPPASSANTRSNSIETVTHTVLNQRLETFGVELSLKLNANIAAAVKSAVQDSISTLQRTFDEKVIELETALTTQRSEFDAFVKKSEENHSLLIKKISELEAAAVAQINHNNDKEQRGRNRTVRIHNRKIKVKDARSSMLDSYDFIIKDSFDRALLAGEIDKVPSLQECGEMGHPLRSRKEGDTPAVLFRFTSRFFFNIFLKHARDIITERNATVKKEDRHRVGRDLTFLNRKVMSSLYDHNLVDKVRLSGTCIQYSLKSDENTWIPVYDVTASCLADMSKKPEFPLINQLMADD